MSKPFLCKQVKETQVTIQTTDGVSSIVLDQSAAEDTIAITTTADAAGVVIANGSTNNAVQLFDGAIFVFSPVGNIIETGAKIIHAGTSLLQQTMITATNSVVLSPAASVYNELNSAVVPGLDTTSRLSIGPPAGGTVINSIVAFDPNPDGRQLWIQNVGTLGGETITLTNQSPAGTAGGLFIGPGDYIIPPGGGVSIMADQNAGAWLVRGI